MPYTKAGTTPSESSHNDPFLRCSRLSQQQDLSKKNVRRTPIRTVVFYSLFVIVSRGEYVAQKNRKTEQSVDCLHLQMDRYFEEDRHVFRLPGVGDAWTLLTSIL